MTNTPRFAVRITLYGWAPQWVSFHRSPKAAARRLASEIKHRRNLYEAAVIDLHGGMNTPSHYSLKAIREAIAEGSIA